MPYIKPERKLFVDKHGPITVGELTYVLFREARDYLAYNYQTHAEVIAAFDNAKEEYRRRFLNPYEDQKREENGDV